MSDNLDTGARDDGQEPEDGADVAAENAELDNFAAMLYGADGDNDILSDEPGSAAAQEVGEAPTQPLSKNQMKKLARLERMKAKRAESRQREKAARAQRRAEILQRSAAELAAMTEEEKAELKQAKKAKLLEHKEQERQLKERLQQSLTSGPRIVLDLDWESKMNANDMRHLAAQIAFSYSANKQVARPAHMMLTSFKGELATVVGKMVSGFDKWYVTRTDQHYGELFSSPEDRSRLVYLTADAEEELISLDESKVYIIGGLVDHNRYKGLCEQQARAAGIATARLPISRHVQLASRAVLTVNHVFQIMVEYFNCRDWATVLDNVLPKRKRADYVQSSAKQQQGQESPEEGQGQEEGNPPGTEAEAAECVPEIAGTAGEEERAAGPGTEHGAEESGAAAGADADVDVDGADEGAAGRGGSSLAVGGDGEEGEGKGQRGTKRKAVEDVEVAA